MSRAGAELLPAAGMDPGRDPYARPAAEWLHPRDEFLRQGADAAGPIHVMNELWNLGKYNNNPSFLEKITASLKEAKTEAHRLKVPLIETNLGKWEKYSMGVENIKGYYCSWPIKYSPLIAWNGDIVLCCWQPSSKNFKFGNINQTNLLKIWNNSIYRRTRRQFARKEILPGCENCKPLGFKDETDKITQSK